MYLRALNAIFNDAMWYENKSETYPLEKEKVSIKSRRLQAQRALTKED
jgi:hypothetical protein